MRAGPSSGAGALFALAARAAAPCERTTLAAAELARIPPAARHPQGRRHWVEGLEDLFGAAAEVSLPSPPFTVGEVVGRATAEALGIDGRRPWAHGAAFAPLLHRAALHVAQALQSRGLDATQTAQRQIVASLARRWNQAAGVLLHHRLEPADVLTGHPGAVSADVSSVFFQQPPGDPSPWLRLFEYYPVLARLLSVVFVNWREALGEMLDRLTLDAARLQDLFADGKDLGALTAYEGGAGDTHAAGRGVTILGFSSGTRLVYKPKDLRIVTLHLKLVALASAQRPNLNLLQRRVLARQGYGWEEWIPARHCAAPTEFEAFYRRFGAHVRLVQLLDGTDFSAQNLIACGDQPVLVDLETLLTPCLRTPGLVEPLRQELAERARDSPFPSGMITLRIAGEPGCRATELGALGAPSNAGAPMCASDAKDELRPPGNGRAFLTGSASPWLAGGEYRPGDFFATIAEGYAAAADWVRESALQLASDQGLLTGLREAPVRFVFRSTHVYTRLLEESLRPACLTDPGAREACLDRLRHGCAPGGGNDALIQAEIDALRDLDIPYFVSRPGDDSVGLPDGRRVDGVFEGTAFSRLCERLESASRRTTSDELDLLRATLFSFSPAERWPEEAAALHSAKAPVVSAPRRSRRRAAREHWLESAVALGDEILACAICRGDDLGWLALNYHARSDLWRLGPLEADLFSGSAGLAVALAELSALSGSPRFGTAARTLLNGLLPLFCEVAELAGDRARRGARIPTICGAYYGPGAWIYACRRGGAVLNDAGLGDEAARRLLAIPRAFFDAAPADFVTGRSGLLMALLAHQRHHENPAIRQLAAGIAKTLVPPHDNHQSASEPDLTQAAPLAGVPHSSDGARLAVAAWDALNGGRTADVAAPPPAAGASVAEVPTRPGDLLVAAALARFLDAPVASITARVTEYLACASFDDAQSLLEAAEVAVTAYQLSAHPPHLAAAEERAREIISRRRRTGRWFAGSVAADRHRLSAVSGLGALLHLFIKIESPLTVGSLRLLQ
jgi:type 2 lantibiotic biosynthesis protein LanM